jgi:LmbE family N-acetylglucosaminyl deacetylase
MNPTHKTVLAFFAHPDDAEILCAGTLIRLAKAGWEIHIATVAAGDCGTMVHSAAEITGIRYKEGVAGAKIIGGAYHSLLEPDGRVVYDKPTLQKSIDLFRQVAPSLVFTHAPKDYMMDHEMVSMLARAASFVYGAPNVSTHPRKPESTVPWLYYCDPVGGTDPFGKPVNPTTIIDITPQIEQKAQALAAHASQRDWLRAHHGMDEYIDSMKRHGQMRGKEIGTTYAEAFVQHLGHPYPHDDVLTQLFSAVKV